MSYKLSIVKNKMMKRIINILILLCCIASLSSCGNSTEERSRVLKIYNWADYIDEDVLAEFPDWYKQQTGEDLRIIYQVFDINEIMLTKIERGHEDFDVVCPSEYIIERMLRKDLLLPIDRNFGHTPDYIPNVSPYIRHELNKTSQPERQTEDYAVPYMWGTAGILFNKKFITAEEADTWDILWDSKNRGKILMKDSYRDAYGTAIIYAHARELADSTVTVEQLMNDNSPQAIALAEQRLKEMKPNIAGWEADFGKEMMTKNKAWINFTWSGDAVWAIEEAEAYRVGGDFLRIDGYSQMFMMMEITMQGVFYGLGRTVPPAIVSIGCNYMRIPVALLLVHMGMGVDAIWWAVSGTTVAKGLILTAWFVLIKRKIL